MRWEYSMPGAPLWEWVAGGLEQAVLFFDVGAPFSPGFPPMTDEQVRIWKEAHERRR